MDTPDVYFLPHSVQFELLSESFHRFHISKILTNRDRVTHWGNFTLCKLDLSLSCKVSQPQFHAIKAIK